LRTDFTQRSHTRTRIEQLRQAATLTGDFLKLIANPGNAGTRTRLPPDGLLNIVGREKFERHDRAWETAIASEAAAQGWSFLELTTDIPVERAETWSRDLAEKLWPNGVVLFVESASTDNVIGSNWRGRWLLAINPRLTGPEKLAAEISATSGISVLPQVRTLFRSGSMG
jgi:hypothetical protein